MKGFIHHGKIGVLTVPGYEWVNVAPGTRAARVYQTIGIIQVCP